MTINNVGASIPLTEPDKKEDTSPDNYPSYGNKSIAEAHLPLDEILIATPGDRPGSARGTTGAQTEGREEGPDNYPSYGDKSDKEGPDNYPSYGDKSDKEGGTKPENKSKAPAESILLEDSRSQPVEFYLASGPDNYPAYGDK